MCMLNDTLKKINTARLTVLKNNANHYDSKDKIIYLKEGVSVLNYKNTDISDMKTETLLMNNCLIDN